MAVVLKTTVGETLPGVRIPLPPPTLHSPDGELRLGTGELQPRRLPTVALARWADAVESGIARLAEETTELKTVLLVGAPLRRNGRLYNCGLAIARGFTEAMNGTLTAYDTPGGGLTMTIDLPTAEPAAAP